MKKLLFTVYVRRVGTTKEWPISKVITEAEEEFYRDYHQFSPQWNNWADRNQFYRDVRIGVTPYEG